MTYTVSTQDIHDLTTSLRSHVQLCPTCSGFLHYAANDGLQAENLKLCELGRNLLLDGVIALVRPLEGT